MGPLEIMARAGWENNRPVTFEAWEDLEQVSRDSMIDDMRASLRALAECEPTKAMMDGAVELTAMPYTPKWTHPDMFRAGVSAYILAAAEEGAK